MERINIREIKKQGAFKAPKKIPKELLNDKYCTERVCNNLSDSECPELRCKKCCLKKC